MDINLGQEQIIELQAVYSAQDIADRALAKRVDAFGQMAKFIQRAKPEDIDIKTTQKRYEPFWYASATARYEYDRRHTYRVETTSEVQGVTVYGSDLPVTPDHGANVFMLDAVQHCVEESHRDLMVDALTSREGDLSRYLGFGKREVSVDTLQQDGALVVVPEVRSSFVVRKLVSLMMKTFQADKIKQERIDVDQIILYYRPVYAVEYLWRARQKTQVVEFDALTGDVKAEGGEIKKQVTRVLENDALFDIGADAVGTILPGANIAVKLGRLAARRVVR